MTMNTAVPCKTPNSRTLWVRDRDTRSYLRELRSNSVTRASALGFDMDSETVPFDQGLLVQTVTRGRPRGFFNKPSVFDPVAIDETRFVEDHHRADPSGRVLLSATDELVLWQ